MVARLTLVMLMKRIRGLKEAALSHRLLRTSEGLANRFFKLIGLELSNLWRFYF